jgi:hypothetical protein
VNVSPLQAGEEVLLVGQLRERLKKQKIGYVLAWAAAK